MMRHRLNHLKEQAFYRLQEFYLHPGAIATSDSTVSYRSGSAGDDEADEWRLRSSPKTPSFPLRLWRQADTGQWMFAAVRVRSVLLTVAALLLLIIAPAYSAFFVSNTQCDLTFRASSTLNSTELMRSLSQQTGARMFAYLHEYPEHCGISAPNFRVYQRYMIVRIAGVLIESFNPSYVHARSARNYTQEEAPVMCQDLQHRHLALRADRILWSYDSPVSGALQQSIALEGREAACVQHYVDILNGQWMCKLSTNGSDVMIPRLPVTTHTTL
jgi:peptide deformylase